MLICSYCGSEQIRVSEKEAYTGWQIGLPHIAHYKKDEKATYTEADCLKCGKRFPPELGETQTSDIDRPPRGSIGKQVIVQTRMGLEVPAKVIDEAVIKVMTKIGYVLADNQLLIEMRENVINMD